MGAGPSLGGGPEAESMKVPAVPGGDPVPWTHGVGQRN